MISASSRFQRHHIRRQCGAYFAICTLVLTLLVSGMPRGGLHSHAPVGQAPDPLHQVFDTLALVNHAAHQGADHDGEHADHHQGLHAHDATAPAVFLGAGSSRLLTSFTPATWLLPVDALPRDSIAQLPLQRPPIA